MDKWREKKKQEKEGEMLASGKRLYYSDYY